MFETPLFEETRLHGRRFDITCPVVDQARATDLLTDLDDWADRIGMDERSLLGFPRWSAADVRWLLQERVRLREVPPPSEDTLRPYLDIRVISQTPLWSREAGRCARLRSGPSAPADAHAEEALETSDLATPLMAWAQVNRAMCRWVHLDRGRVVS